MSCFSLVFSNEDLWSVCEKRLLLLSMVWIVWVVWWNYFDYQLSWWNPVEKTRSSWTTSFCYSETSLESHSYSYKLLFFHFLLLFKHLTKNTAIRTPSSLVPWCFPMHWQNHKCGNVVYKWFYLLIDGEFSQTSYSELTQLEWTQQKRRSCCVLKLTFKT